MTVSRCAKCGGTYWEIALLEPQGARYKQNFVQCVGCGTPVGVLDYYNPEVKLENLESLVAGLGSLLAQLDQRLRNIEQTLRK